MTWKIPLFKLNYDQEEEKAVKKVLSSEWLTMGEETISFEEYFSSFLGKNIYSVAVSSGTASMHLALMSLNLKKKDEVIIPALTFVSDANTVSICGGTPILADSKSSEDWNVSLNSIKEKFSKNTKAIIVVHFAGYPCSEIKEISQFSKKNNLTLIEDVAHAPGASIFGKKCGTFGDYGSFSFFSNKNIAVGEGGMITTKNKRLYKKVKFIRSHGMSSLTLDRHKGRSFSYDVLHIGLNYRIDEIRSALGRVQLKKLNKANVKRKHLTERYIKNLGNSEILIPFTEQPKSSISSYHIMPILLSENSSRESVMKKLKKNGIQSSIHYPPFWNFSAYKGKFSQKDSPNTAKICQNELTLPLYPSMKLDDVDYVSEVLINSI